jgi:uncharacterized protein YjiS (DUF1127 family)
MTALEFATETMQPAARPAFLARGINAVSQLVRSWKNRRAFYRLGDMSDAELADIGLTRGDLHVALTGPFGLDPTTRLRSIADERAIESAARLA